MSKNKEHSYKILLRFCETFFKVYCDTKDKSPNSPVYVIPDKGVKALIVVEWIK